MALSATPLNTATLKDADRYYRLADFQKAYTVSSRVVSSDEFTTWKAKQRHDAAKAFIRHGHHSDKCAPLRAWQSWRSRACEFSVCSLWQLCGLTRSQGRQGLHRVSIPRLVAADE